MIKNWIRAARLRTLPLAIANIVMGNTLAGFFGAFDWSVLWLTLLTAISLQVLSNLANDLGDSIHGADHEDRKGPSRLVQSGVISQKQMRNAVTILSGITFLSGLGLVFVALDSLIIQTLFIILGALCIWAAINYTGGSKPYGYRGFGDLSVLFFFGWVAVVGSFFLQTGFFNWSVLLPATSCGLFSIAVLNINNIRDIESDKIAGKQSIPVQIGRRNAVTYHIALLLIGLCAACVFMFLHFRSIWQFSFLIIVPLLFINVLAVWRYKDPIRLDPYLKQMALTNLIFVILFGFGLLI